MSETHKYIQAATRKNTRLSYRSAIEHYEDVWGGFLPATADSVASYLAHFAPTLAVSTLKQRLAALAAWHNEQGFPDPTKAPHVKKVLKGIAELHPHQEKQARPLQIEQLSKIDAWITQQLQDIGSSPHGERKLLRDRAMLLLGFWRAFRSDELTRMTIENVRVMPNQGLEIFVPRSKTDRARGRHFKAPALKRLCPVSAFQAWTNILQATHGPLFPAINQWGHIAEHAINPVSVIAIVKSYCEHVGFEDADNFSSHSLRRGFATWATGHGWDTKTLMEYVGWKDVKSAMRYIDHDDAFAQQRIGHALSLSDAPETPGLPQRTALNVELAIERYSKHTRGMTKTRSLIERYCLSSLAMETLDQEGKRYRIHIDHEDAGQLDERIDDLLHRMHQIAGDNHCMLEATIRHPETDQVWD
ncbi:site-specific integrase [Sessilibacter corallicola]|uniref:Site-specific integrase n=1 Tax=Sessilibacter corallicola TaxID=2904075 RepID=A0ABQ0AF73_9GAMM